MFHRNRFSLRTLMLAVTGCAFLFSFLMWKLHPSTEFSVTLHADGTACINDEIIQNSEIYYHLERELWWRRIWRMEPTMQLSADSVVPFREFMDIIRATKRGGIKKYQLQFARENSE